MAACEIKCPVMLEDFEEEPATSSGYILDCSAFLFCFSLPPSLELASELQLSAKPNLDALALPSLESKSMAGWVMLH